MDGLILVLFALFAILIAGVIVISFETFIRWQETVLKILDGSRSRPIRFIFFAALGCWLTCGLRIHSFSLPPIWHRSVLCLVCIYTFVFFNPIQALSTSKAQQTVYCPDGYAYRLATGEYIRCEDFDLFHAELASAGRVRTDLYIK